VKTADTSTGGTHRQEGERHVTQRIFDETAKLGKLEEQRSTIARLIGHARRDGGVIASDEAIGWLTAQYDRVCEQIGDRMTEEQRKTAQFFGACPVCHEPGHLVDIPGIEAMACHVHCLYWIWECTFTLVLKDGTVERLPAEEDERMRRNRELLDSYENVEEYLPPDEPALTS
jgi:hypothetical protein